MYRVLFSSSSMSDKLQLAGVLKFRGDLDKLKLIVPTSRAARELAATEARFHHERDCSRNPPTRCCYQDQAARSGLVHPRQSRSRPSLARSARYKDRKDDCIVREASRAASTAVQEAGADRR